MKKIGKNMFDKSDISQGNLSVKQNNTTLRPTNLFHFFKVTLSNVEENIKEVCI